MVQQDISARVDAIIGSSRNPKQLEGVMQIFRDYLFAHEQGSLNSAASLHFL